MDTQALQDDHIFDSDQNMSTGTHNDTDATKAEHALPPRNKDCLWTEEELEFEKSSGDDSFTLRPMVIDPKFLDRLLDLPLPDIEDEDPAFDFRPLDGSPSTGMSRGSMVR